MTLCKNEDTDGFGAVASESVGVTFSQKTILSRDGMPARVAASVVGLSVFGTILDHSIPISTTPLFAGFMTASVLGVALGGLPLLKHLQRPRDAVVSTLCLYVVWRLTYFPFMVFAGTGAAYGESIAIWCGFRPLIFAPFLLLMAAMHGVSTWLIGRSIVSRRRLILLPIGLALLPAAAVSLSQSVDLHPLPDRCWHDVPNDRLINDSVGNPYLPALKRPEYQLHQRVLLLAAGLTYDLIPGSPWSQSVQVTLEQLFRENPSGSTADRVREHYFGYLAAHLRIGESSSQQSDHNE